MYKILTIAGSDSSGGAGIEADIKTITVHRMFALCAITALTAQNTTGVFDVVNVPTSHVAAQINAVFDDIPPDAVKIGMVSTAKIITTIAERLVARQAKNIVVDPVMVATSGARLLEMDAIDALRGKLLPIATLITPNIPEAELLAEIKINSRESMEQAAKIISRRYGDKAAVLVKGGHLTDSADDLLYSAGESFWLRGEKIATTSTHGTGCTLSSAIACHLAAGASPLEAVSKAKNYITAAIKAAPPFGRGNGPLNHMVSFSSL